MRALLIAVVLAVACSGAPGGPAQLGKVNKEPAAPAGPPLQSNDIMAREAQANRTRVKHILIGWQDLKDKYPGDMDPRAAARTKEEAEQLVQQLYLQIKNGAPIEPLMEKYSEDPGSAATGHDYEVAPDAQLAFEFKRMGLRLKVGEVGKVLSDFGWHIMLRVE